MNAREACEECTQKCLENHGQMRDPYPIMTSFYKLIYGNYKFEKYLRLPPRVSTNIPGLADGETCILEDCNGKQSIVEVDIRDGDLAFTTGWDKFYEEHGLTEGNIVFFSYTPSHFAVRIFDNTCCEKVNYVKANDKKRSTTDGNVNAKDGKRQKCPSGSIRKQGSATSSISRSENRTQREFTSNDQPPNDSGLSGQGGNNQSEPMSKDKRPASENGNCVFQPDSTADMEQIGVDGEGNNGENFHSSMELDTSTSLLDENQVSKIKKINDPPMSKTMEVIGNDNRNSNPSAPLIDKHVGGHTETTPMSKEVKIINKDHNDGDPAGRQFQTQASGRAKVNQLRKKMEVARSDHHDGNLSCPPLQKHSVVHADSSAKTSTAAKKKIVKRKEVAEKEKHTSETLKAPKEQLMEGGKTASGKSYNENRTSSEAKKGTEAKVKTEPVDSFDYEVAEASGISFVVTVESQEFLQLPDTIWDEHAKEMRGIVDLKGPDGRVWPAIYIQKHGVQALRGGWTHFFKTYGLQKGFECTFTLESGSDPQIVYKVGINK